MALVGSGTPVITTTQVELLTDSNLELHEVNLHNVNHCILIVNGKAVRLYPDQGFKTSYGQERIQSLIVKSPAVDEMPGSNFETEVYWHGWAYKKD